MAATLLKICHGDPKLWELWYIPYYDPKLLSPKTLNPKETVGKGPTSDRCGSISRPWIVKIRGSIEGSRRGTLKEGSL